MSTVREVPVWLQKTSISNELNSTVLAVFLWGIYSVIYLATLYLYLTKKSSGSRLIVGAITLSYVAYSVPAIVDWFYDQAAVVNDSETREALFFVLTELGPTWPVFINTLMSFILAGVADGILIWRCFHVWDHSLRWISVPLLLLFCEIVMDLAVLILQITQHLNAADSQLVVDAQLFAAQVFVTFATTLTSTSLIAYRIHVTSKEDISRHTKRRFQRVIEILLESAAVYSAVALAEAISSVIPGTLSDLASVQAASDYTSALFQFIAGVAPTILVARVAILGDQDTYSSNALSMPGSLRFHVRSTVQEISQRAERNTHVSSGFRDIADRENMSREASNV